MIYIFVKNITIFSSGSINLHLMHFFEGFEGFPLKKNNENKFKRL